MDYRLEVVALPVSDVDAAIAFYRDGLGFHLDHDVETVPGIRVVQCTPPGSPTSIAFGTGMALGEPGTTRGLQLVVRDIEAAREELAGRGVDVGEVRQLGPEGMDGSRFLFFSDPDGNGWSVQELRRDG
ncbi:VOC family protein [Amnibacterium endophyticum]|uniref:VOC family protein n=1 Tax=Amnibacterium endophyticum TaxID=2109337 RepID=A0ABW4LFT2_9MICO